MSPHENRRRNDRHRVAFPVEVSSPHKRDRIGMCRNGSATGMLLGTPSRFEVGDSLTLSFSVHKGAPANLVTAKIVRLDEEAANRDHWCHRLVAVEFDSPQPSLERAFAELAPRQAHLFTRS